MQHCKSKTMQQCNIATVKQCNIPAVEQCNIATVKQCNIATVKLTMQHCNSETDNATLLHCSSCIVSNIATLQQLHCKQLGESSYVAIACINAKQQYSPTAITFCNTATLKAIKHCNEFCTNKSIPKCIYDGSVTID